MAKATILFVDNDRDFLETSAAFLESKGFQVVATRTQQEARKKLELENIDLAIIDLRLSSDEDEEDVSGYRLASEFPVSLPKIILTYFADPQTPLQFRSPTATELIAKAQGPTILLATIEGLLRNKLAGDSTTDAPPPESKEKKKRKGK